MSDISPEIRELLKQYDGDTKAILKEYPRLDYLYAVADMRENVLEWFDFDENGDLLQSGSDYGALTGLYARRVRSVTVIDPYKGNLELNRLRHREYDNIAVSYNHLLLFNYHAGRLSGVFGSAAKCPAVWFILSLGGSAAVSYTHLDVYKRQTIN